MFLVNSFYGPSVARMWGGRCKRLYKGCKVTIIRTRSAFGESAVFMSMAPNSQKGLCMRSSPPLSTGRGREGATNPPADRQWSATQYIHGACLTFKGRPDKSSSKRTNGCARFYVFFIVSTRITRRPSSSSPSPNSSARHHEDAQLPHGGCENCAAGPPKRAGAATRSTNVSSTRNPTASR